MTGLLQDLRFGMRSIMRQRSFSVVTILTLGLGIGTTTAIFSVVNRLLLQPLPYGEAERIVALWQTDRDEPQPDEAGSVPHLTFRDWQERARSFDALALYGSINMTLTGLGDAEVVRGAEVTPDFFRVFDSQPVLGRTFTADEDRPNGPSAVIVSWGFWQARLGGRTDVLGRTLTIGGRDWEIVGVTPEGFAYPPDARLYQPVRNDDEGCGRDCSYLDAVGRLAEGVSVAAAHQEMKAIAAQLAAEYPAANSELTAGVASLREQTIRGVRRALVILLGAVGLVLLIACANVANLMLVRGAARTDEVAIRAVLGASRARLVRQLMTESVLLAVIGGGLGLLLAGWGIVALRALAPSDLPRIDEITLDPVALGFALLLALITALLFGLVPAVRAARVPLGTVVREGGRGGPGRAGRGIGRRAILVAEVALSVLLLVGAGLMIRSLIALQQVDTGFSREDAAIFSVSLPDASYGTPEARLLVYDELAARMESSTGGTVTRVMGLPLARGLIVTSFSRTDQPPPEPGQDPFGVLRVVDADYFGFMDIALRAGRGFDASDRLDGERVVVISQALADRYLPDADPIGRSIDLGLSIGVDEDRPRRIIGVVENIRSTSLVGDALPEMYVPLQQAAPHGIAYLVRASNQDDVLSIARTELRAVDANLPLIRPGTLSQLIGTHTARPTFYLLLLGLFALLAVLLAAVGIYGVVAYLVVQRTREIGVRMALGAPAREVVALVVGQGLAPALAGIAIGVAGAVAAGRVIASLLYETAPHDPMTYTAVIAFLILVVLAACALPAWRATRIPPNAALRAD